ncbi:MAG: thymidine phosphorylase, partial [Schwartzia sp. (in: firmicutes)]
LPKEQMAAFLMAVWFRGMTDRETTDLTLAMLKTGAQADLSAIPGRKVDKHSTGGVGDKTTLIIAPLVAACGGVVAKMSGRGLGHTGGTVDKLESIPGFRASLGETEFFDVVKRCGLAVIGQSAALVPADKKIYALRDVTGSVDSIPLIASSVMSKKLAGGADGILLDVTVGSGAFMKRLPDALRLAETMVAIGEAAGRRTEALITDMDAPLGRAVGNALEVAEAVDVLKGGGPADLREVSLSMAAHMLHLAGRGSVEETRAAAEKALADGAAFEKLCAMAEAQGGDASVLRDLEKLPLAPCNCGVVCPEDAYITHVDAEKVGLSSMALGAGRETLTDPLDLAAGITLLKKPGDFVKKGDVLAVLHTSDERRLPEAQRIFGEAIRGGAEPPKKRPLIFARVTKERVEWLTPWKEEGGERDDERR